MSIKSLLSELNGNNAENRKSRFETLLTTKTDKWLADFYLLLGEEANASELKRALSNVAIIRVSDSTNNISHVKPTSAFLATEGVTDSRDFITSIKKEIWADLSDTQKESLNRFFLTIGVKEYTELALIQLELENQKKYTVASEHYRFIARCIKYLKKDPSQISLFRSKPILATDVDSSHVVLTDSRELVLDSPYRDTGLSALCPYNTLKVLSNGYCRQSDIPQKDFIEFAIGIGVRTELEIIETSDFSDFNRADLHRGFEYKKETVKKTRIDYTIPNLERYLDNAQSIKTSLLVWKALLSAPSYVVNAKYSPNGTADINQSPSTLICILKNYAWIPNKDGSFVKPEKVLKNDLHPDFIPDYSKGLLKAIDFGSLEEASTAAYQEKAAFARAIGFKDLKEAEEIVTTLDALRNRGLNINQFLQKTLSEYDVEEPQQFPEKAVKNPERREAKLSDIIEESSEKKFEKRERAVQVNKSSIDARTWLKTLYTNENGVMLCQICQNPMPFNKRDGQPYFEAVELFTKDLITKEFEATHVALCPVCSAKYQEYIKQEDSAMGILQHAILNVKKDVLAIPITLDSRTKNASIRFVESHLFDLKRFLQQELNTLIIKFNNAKTDQSPN